MDFNGFQLKLAMLKDMVWQKICYLDFNSSLKKM